MEERARVRPGQLREYRSFGQSVGVIAMVIGRSEAGYWRMWQCIRVSDGHVFEAHESGVPWCIASTELLVDVE